MYSYGCSFYFISESSMHEYQIIVACDLNGAIGYKNTIPWRAPIDMQRFRLMTSSASSSSHLFNASMKMKAAEGALAAVVMGRKTYESLPLSFRPLPNRVNIVVSSQSAAELNYPEEVIVARSVHEALSETLAQRIHVLKNVKSFWVIGGGQLYDECMTDPLLRSLCTAVHVSRIQTQLKKGIQCDTFLHPIYSSPSLLAAAGFKKEDISVDSDSAPLAYVSAGREEKRAVPIIFEKWVNMNASLTRASNIHDGYHGNDAATKHKEHDRSYHCDCSQHHFQPRLKQRDMDLFFSGHFPFPSSISQCCRLHKIPFFIPSSVLSSTKRSYKIPAWFVPTLLLLFISAYTIIMLVSPCRAVPKRRRSQRTIIFREDVNAKV